MSVPKESLYVETGKLQVSCQNQKKTEPQQGRLGEQFGKDKNEVMKMLKTLHQNNLEEKSKTKVIQ